MMNSVVSGMLFLFTCSACSVPTYEYSRDGGALVFSARYTIASLSTFVDGFVDSLRERAIDRIHGDDKAKFEFDTSTIRDFCQLQEYRPLVPQYLRLCGSVLEDYITLQVHIDVELNDFGYTPVSAPMRVDVFRLGDDLVFPSLIFEGEKSEIHRSYSDRVKLAQFECVFVEGYRSPKTEIVSRFGEFTRELVIVDLYEIDPSQCS